jgi:hypothetical protein
MTSGNFKGWSLKEFVKGREKLLVTAVGFVATYLITQNPVFSGIIGASAELVYALIKYYASE